MEFFTIECSDPSHEFDGLRFLTVKSPALGRRADVTVFVPAGTESQTDLPLVTLLHGVYGSHWAWALKGGAHRTAAGLIARGELPPLVLAMPSDGLWWDGSGYLPHHDADYERWIVEEVPALIRQTIPQVSAASSGYLAGLSMGGYGALRLGARNPDRYQAFAGLSSMTAFEQFDRFHEGGSERIRSAARRPENVLDVLLENRGALRPFRFDCGTEDPLLAANRELHARLAAAGVPHDYHEYPGGHEWPYWQTHLADVLRFFNTTADPAQPLQGH
jgi:putative tributyrin esterase